MPPSVRFRGIAAKSALGAKADIAKSGQIVQTSLMTGVSKTLLQQRIRNRIIEYLDLSFEDVAQWGAFETINQWEDFVPDGWEEEFHTLPVFDLSEQSEIKAFCDIWGRTADATEIDIFSVDTLQNISEWVMFVQSAQKSYKVFMRRGRFSDDEERF